MQERISNNESFDEEHKRKIQRYQDLKKMVKALREDMAYKSFICELIEDCKIVKPNIEIIFDTSLFDEVINENEINFSYNSLRQFDILLVDKKRDAIAICYHPNISADYPVTVDLKRFDLHHCVQLLFMPVDTYRTRPNDGNERYYFEDCHFLLLLKKALQSNIKEKIEEEQFKKWMALFESLLKENQQPVADVVEAKNTEQSTEIEPKRNPVAAHSTVNKTTKTKDEIFEDLRKMFEFKEDEEKKLENYLNLLVKAGVIQYIEDKGWYAVCNTRITEINIAFWLNKVFVDILKITKNGGIPWSNVSPLIRNKNQEVYKSLKTSYNNKRNSWGDEKKAEEEMLRDFLRRSNVSKEDIFPSRLQESV